MAACILSDVRCHLVHFALDKLKCVCLLSAPRHALRRVRHAAFLYASLSTCALISTLCRQLQLALILLRDFNHRAFDNLNIFRREVPSFKLWSLIVYRGALLIHVEGDVGM